jgi:hypothetical protein
LKEFAAAAGDHAIERDPRILPGSLEHVGIAIREHDELVSGLQAGERLWHFRKGPQLLDLRYKISDLVHSVGDAGALENIGYRPMADLAIGSVLPMEQCVDH